MCNIKCKVEECAYWGDDMYCHAEAIDVASSAADRKVNASQGTMCQTFEMRNE